MRYCSGGSCESGIEGLTHLLQPVGHTFDETQDMVDFLGCKATLAGHAWFYTHLVLCAGGALGGLLSQQVPITSLAKSSPVMVGDTPN